MEEKSKPATTHKKRRVIVKGAVQLVIASYSKCHASSEFIDTLNDEVLKLIEHSCKTCLSKGKKRVMGCHLNASSSLSQSQ